MRPILITLVVLGGLLSGLSAQSLPHYPTDLLLQQDQTSILKGKDKDKKLELIQANFLENIFLKEAFGNNALAEFNEGEDDLVNNSHMQMYNDIMIHMLAKELAKQDLLGMKKQYNQYMKQLNAEQQRPQVLAQ